MWDRHKPEAFLDCDGMVHEFQEYEHNSASADVALFVQKLEHSLEGLGRGQNSGPKHSRVSQVLGRTSYVDKDVRISMLHL